MRRYKYKIDYSWNPEIAYIAGLIASDGCMANDHRHINITSKDICLLESAAGLIGTTSKIQQKRSGFGSIGYYLQFSNVALYDFLFNAGIHPTKSKTIGSIDVPDKFYRDFLRGYFDGDGTVYGYWDPRWPKSLMYYTGYVSASHEFILWLQTTNTRLCLTSNGRIKKNKGAETLTYAKTDSKLLFDFMYYKSDLPVLARKREKFIDFLRIDPYADKAHFARVL